jgi:hypothetical protein
MVSNTTPKCDGCHGTGVDVKVVIHNDDCQNCHINITDNGSFQDGTELDSALADTVAGDATGHVVGTANTDCLGCHSGYASNFVAHDATISNPSHSDNLTGSSKCTGCHSGANIVADVHYATSATDTDCENCHYDTQQPDTDGRLWDGSNANSVGGALEYGTAQGHTIGGPASTCISCHNAYDGDFDGSHSTGGSHTNLTTSGAAECTDCHGTGDVITNIHAGGVGCEHCHTDMTTPSNEDGTLKGSATRYSGGSTTCLDCHTEIAGQFDHALHTQSGANDTHDAMLANFNDDLVRSQDCDNCHTAANGTAVVNLHNGSIATAQGGICQVCHINLTDDGRLRNQANDVTTKGEASNHTFGVQSDCTTCHGLTFFAAHDYGDTHTGISYAGGAPDTSFDDLQGCGNCHDGFNADLNGIPLDSWTDIWAEHNSPSPLLANGCVRCHDYDKVLLNGVDNTTDTAATALAISNGAGTTETCATCHLAQVPNNNHTGQGQAEDVLTITKTDWINDGDGATTGTLTVWADSTQNNGLCNYSIDYNGETTGTPMNWNAVPPRYYYTFTSTTFNNNPGEVSITSGGSPCDADGATADANDISDTVIDILGPGPGGGAYYDPANNGTLTVWATHLYNDGSLNYIATYNGDHSMNWISGNSRYERTVTGIDPYIGTVTVHSSEPGGGTRTEAVEQAVVDDVVTNISGTWLNDGDGATTGTLYVTFDTDDAGNSNNCIYTVNYDPANGGSDTAVFNTVPTEHFAATITGVNSLKQIASIEVDGTSPCADQTFNTAPDVDNSDVYTVTSASWNNDSLTVYATESGDNPQTACETATFANYNGINYGPMIWVGDPTYEFQLVDEPVTGGYNGTGAKTDGQVTVHCAEVGGGTVTYNSVADESPVSGNLMPKHTLHEASQYVTWGSKLYVLGTDNFDQAIVPGESCFNCHGPHDGTLDVVMDVHNAKCDLCHTDASGGGGDLISAATRGKDLNQDGSITEGPEHVPADISQSNDGIGAGTCSYCHKGYMSQKNSIDLRFKTWNHHLSYNAQAGNCVNCHDSVRTTAVGSSWCVVQGSRVPKQPPCAYCHVDPDRAYGGDGAWQLQFFNFAADGFNTPLTKLTSTTHTIPNIDGVPGNPDVDPLVVNADAAVRIHDFAVCFECHDTTDMFDGLVDGLGTPIHNPTLDTVNRIDPNKVYPYHASGMPLDLLNGTAQQRPDDPGPGNWFPVDAANAPARTADDGKFDDVNFGPQASDDYFFAYHYHPGRGGIVGTSDVISGVLPNYVTDVANQIGSFNILFPVMTPFNGSSAPKYYQSGGAESGTNNAQKNAYDENTSSNYPNYSADNFGTGGKPPTATPNGSYIDVYGNEWDFSIQHNIPYTDYKINPNPANDLYWSRVPKFPDMYNPTMTDIVRLLTVDCGNQIVTARTFLTGDYNLHRTDVQPADWVNWTGDVKITSPETVDMTYDGFKWSGSLSAACANPDTVTVTSYIGNAGAANGSASFTVP